MWRHSTNEVSSKGRVLRYDPRVTTFEQAAVSLTRGLTNRIEARSRRKADRAANRTITAPAIATVRRLILTVGALGAFTYAAAGWHMWAGLVVGGVCALYLEQASSGD